MTVALAEATAADFELLVRYMRELRRDDPMPTEVAVGFENSVAAVQKLINDDTTGRVWIIRADAEPVGYVALTFGYSIEFGGRTAFVDELFIDSSQRGRGVGKAALQLVTERASSLDLRVLFLELTDSNIGAERLYRGAGFIERDYKLMWKRLVP